MASRGSDSEAHPKRVAYLWGAGATQAEIDYRNGPSINLLMSDSDERGPGVATRILERLPQPWATRFASDGGPDVEKLISLCASCNVPRYAEIAETLRRLYFEDICRRLADAGILTAPTLATALLTLHSQERFKDVELLTGIITTNHDGLLQSAFQDVLNGVNLGIPFRSRRAINYEAAAPPLLQLHGSFTWRYGDPIYIRPLRANSRYLADTVWVPPTTTKEAKLYPFNKLAAAAYETLTRQCDVLRIVGASLTQNDWHVLSMIFSAQQHVEHRDRTTINIELIMPRAAAEAIIRSCSFLKNLIPIGHLGEGDFEGYRAESELPNTSELRNPLFYWLKQKIQFHHREGHLGAEPLAGILASVAGVSP